MLLLLFGWLVGWMVGWLFSFVLFVGFVAGFCCWWWWLLLLLLLLLLCDILKRTIHNEIKTLLLLFWGLGGLFVLLLFCFVLFLVSAKAACEGAPTLLRFPAALGIFYLRGL